MTPSELLTLQTRAAAGEADAQYRLAMQHVYGDGVAEDISLAFDLLQKAAAQDHTEAVYNLAVCYFYGHGTEVDLEAAFRLYRKSADAGYGKGMEVVGRFYNRGIYVPRDRAEAELWLQKAIHSGDPDAEQEARAELLRNCET